jgi:hypothetical protein
MPLYFVLLSATLSHYLQLFLTLLSTSRFSLFCRFEMNKFLNCFAASTGAREHRHKRTTRSLYC